MSSESTVTTPSSPLFGIPGLPEQVLETYARLWQLETSLRELVYVQLRAKSGDAWDSEVSKALRAKNSDKRLVHMPTVEESLLSYAQLSDLIRIIEGNWSLFESYLPPQSIWNAKLEEVSQIRHRVAHFRSAHEDDLARVVQLLRDLDAGFWRFCTSYNDAQPVIPATDDPVVEAFLDLDLFPWTEVGERRYARLGSVAESESITATIEVLKMPWALPKVPVAGESGFLYNVQIYARGLRHFDQARLLKSTHVLHKHLVHILLDDGEKLFRFTIPTCIGADQVKKLITQMHDSCLYALVSGLGTLGIGRIQQLADSYPEYVLGPGNPLGFLSPDMPCSIFCA